MSERRPEAGGPESAGSAGRRGRHPQEVFVGPQVGSCGARRLAVCSWSLRPRSPAELVESLGHVGLRAVQLALVPIVEEPAVWGDAIALLRSAGIEIVSGMLATVGEDYTTLQSIAATGGVRPDATWPATLERAARVAEVAGAAGLPLVTFHAGFIPHAASDPARDVLLERLRTLVDLFAGFRVNVAFETGQEEADTLLSALGDLRRPEAGVNFDPANMILYGMGEPVAALRKLRARVRQVHVKDALPPLVHGEWGQEVAAGSGVVDWRAFFEVVATLDPPVDLVIEREAGPSREADVRGAAALVRRFVGV